MASVFIPVSFIGGTSGTFYREFGMTMAISIFISALNALTLSPALCAIFLKPHSGEKKMSRIDRMHAAFNTQYDKIQNKYKNTVEKLVRKPVLTVILLLLGIGVLGYGMWSTKTGLVPDEDTGTLFCTLSMPPATSVQRTKEVAQIVDSMLANNPAIKSREMIQGYNFIAGAGSDQATFIIKLKSFSERASDGILGLFKGKGIKSLFINPMDANMVLGMIYKQTAAIKDAKIIAFAPPMIPGFSATNGVSMVMQDKTGGSLNDFFNVTNEYLAELNKRPEIQMAMTSYNPTTRSIW